jgi:predicted lipoprotein with Yx(FWY)xxD motif
MSRRTQVVVGALALVTLVGACGSSGSSKSSSSSAKNYGGSGSSSSTSAPASGSATVSTADSQYGKILVDADGHTLYLYTPNHGTTNSVPAAILAAWPLLQAHGTPVPGQGIDAAKLTTAEQSDGVYVAYNGNLLYHFSGDTAAGQTNGQGLGGVWYVVSAAGDKVTS